MCNDDGYTDKDCMYAVGLQIGGFLVDSTLPDTPGQPEKSLARYLCRQGFSPEEIAAIILRLRYSMYLRAVSIAVGHTTGDITDPTSLQTVSLFFTQKKPVQDCAAAIRNHDLYADALGL